MRSRALIGLCLLFLFLFLALRQGPLGTLSAGEIARGVLFLVADDAGFVTGSTLSINGGQHMY